MLVDLEPIVKLIPSNTFYPEIFLMLKFMCKSNCIYLEQNGNGIVEIDNNMTEKVTRAVHNISYIARSTFGRKSFDSTHL